MNRRARWLWGALEQFRAACAASVPADPVQRIGTSAIPVRHPSRVRGAGRGTGPGNDLTARFGRDGAHPERFYGLRPAIRTDPGRRIARARSLVPAAIDERQAGTGLITGDAASIDAPRLARGFNGRRFAAGMTSAGIDVIIPPTRAQRQTMPGTPRRPIARPRNRVETPLKEITDQTEPARHGAHTFEGPLTRTVVTLAAHTPPLTHLADAT